MLTYEPMKIISLQGPDEEAVVDLGKTSSTVNTKFEKEELESKFVYNHSCLAG